MLRHISVVLDNHSLSRIDIEPFFAQHGSQLESLHFRGSLFSLRPLLRYAIHLWSITLPAMRDEEITVLSSIGTLTHIGLEYVPQDSVVPFVKQMEQCESGLARKRTEFPSLSRVRLLAQPSRYIKDYDGFWSKACQTFTRHRVRLEDATGSALHPVQWYVTKTTPCKSKRDSRNPIRRR